MTTNIQLYPGWRVAVERFPNGRWRVGRADERGRIADPDKTIELRIGELATSPYDKPAARERALRELQDLRSEHGYLVAWLVAELDQVIEEFHGSVPLEVRTLAEVEAAACQAILCRTWLDFLQGSADYQAGQTADPSRLLLWRRYYRAQATLFELGRTSALLSDILWQDLTGWIEGEYRRALRNWSRILLDPANEWFLSDVVADNSSEMDPDSARKAARIWEREVNEMLWRPDGTLRRFFGARQAGRRFLDRITRQWFLPRYDLHSVSRLSQARVPGGWSHGLVHLLYEPKIRQPWLLVEFVAMILLVAALVGGFWECRVGPALRGDVGNAVARWLLSLPRVWSSGLVVIGVVIASLLCLLVAYATLKIGRMALYPFSLRLAAGTIVGMIALSGLSEQFADFAFNAFGGPERSYNLPTTLVLLTFSLLLAWGYIFVNSLRRLGDATLARRRTWHLFIFGVAQSVVFAALASWLAAGRLVPLGLAGKPTPCRALHLPGGALYPDYIVTAGVLAFVVGVFTQILWEDRSVTEPL